MVEEVDIEEDEEVEVATKTYCDDRYKFGFEYPAAWNDAEISNNGMRM